MSPNLLVLLLMPQLECKFNFCKLTLSRRRPLSCINRYHIDLQSKSMDWFLYHNVIRHERIKH